MEKGGWMGTPTCEGQVGSHLSVMGQVVEESEERQRESMYVGVVRSSPGSVSVVTYT